MNKIRFFAVASTCVLAVAAIFAAKGAKKFTSFATLYYLTLTNNQYHIAVKGSTLTNILVTSGNASSSGVQASIVTAAHTYGLYGGSSHTAVYLPTGM